MTKRLTKSSRNRTLFGVCGGIAEYFNVDVTLVRIITIILAFLHGAGIIAYIICALVMPNNDYEEDVYDDVENLKSANVDEDAFSAAEKPKENSGAKKSHKKSTAHSDAEFNTFFE